MKKSEVVTAPLVEIGNIIKEQQMESLIFLPGIHPPNFSSFTKFKLPTLTFPLKEIADGSLLFTHQFPMSNIRRVRPVQRNSGNRRSINGDYNEKPHLSENGKTYNKEEILALFRRIQSSISAAEFAASKGRTNNASAELVLEVQRQSRKQVKGKTSYREESTRLSEGENNKQEKVERIDSVSNEGSLSRPPSNFMKKSPIPSVHVERVKDDDVMNDTDGEALEAMKLVELKELAKSRGVKGYSKLKKAELIELLKTL